MKQDEWVPMSWTEEGLFYNDQTKEDEKILSHNDLQIEAGAASSIRSSFQSKE